MFFFSFFFSPPYFLRRSSNLKHVGIYTLGSSISNLEEYGHGIDFSGISKCQIT